MENAMKKSARTFGIFATGLMAGYAATMLSRNYDEWYPKIQQKFRGISIPKVAPTIPEFDDELLSVEVDPHLGFHDTA